MKGVFDLSFMCKCSTYQVPQGSFNSSLWEGLFSRRHRPVGVQKLAVGVSNNGDWLEGVGVFHVCDETFLLVGPLPFLLTSGVL